MYDTCPTVKIVAGDSYVVINEDDFDKTTMNLWKGKEPEAAAEPEAPAAEA